jgi:hypothetical protein
MRLAGWKSRQMLGRYGASGADAALAKPTVASPLATGFSGEAPAGRRP